MNYFFSHSVVEYTEFLSSQQSNLEPCHIQAFFLMINLLTSGFIVLFHRKHSVILKAYFEIAVLRFQNDT